MNQTTKSKQCRRWFRFTILMLVLSMILVTCVTHEQQVQMVLLPFGTAGMEEERIEEAAGSERKDSPDERQLLEQEITTTIIETQTTRETK